MEIVSNQLFGEHLCMNYVVLNLVNITEREQIHSLMNYFRHIHIAGAVNDASFIFFIISYNHAHFSSCTLIPLSLSSLSGLP